MNSSNILSVIIPNYNGAKYLPEMLDSIIKQDFSDWRVIVVDDQSTDDSIEVLKKYCELDKRINYIVRNRSPKGAQTCRNIGYDCVSSSKYVIFFDNDDVAAPYCFSQRVAFMEDNEALDFAVFPAKTFRNNPQEEPASFYGIDSRLDDLSLFLVPILPFVVWDCIYKSESIRKYNLVWDENITSLQDSLFNIQCLSKGLKYEYCKSAKVDYYYRKISGGSNISAGINTEKHFPSHIYSLDLLMNLLSSQKHKYKKELRCRCLFFSKKFASNKTYLRKLLNHPLFNNFLFKTKIYLFVRLPNKRLFEFLLFPSEFIYINSLYKKQIKHINEFKKTNYYVYLQK